MRFVIQHHICEDNHYDLMIESGDILLTWRISSNDIGPLFEGAKIRVKKIQDHRKDYLSYEGPISGDRGRVEIFDSGECELISEKKENKNLYQYQINGRIFKYRIRLQQADDFYWLQAVPI